VERSKEFAKRLLDDRPYPTAADRARVPDGLTRRPEPGEVDSALTYVANLEKQLGKADAHLTAWQSLCQVLIATNEFL